MKEALVLTVILFTLMVGIMADAKQIHEAALCGTIGC